MVQTGKANLLMGFIEPFLIKCSHTLHSEEREKGNMKELYTRWILFPPFSCSIVTSLLSEIMQTCQQPRPRPELAYCSAARVMPTVWERIYKGHQHTSARMHKQILAQNLLSRQQKCCSHRFNRKHTRGCLLKPYKLS